jgi:hypothetical protein
MKKHLSICFLSLLLLLSAACSPILRFKNDTGSSIAAWGYTKYVLTYDDVEFDIINLGNGGWTRYKAVKPGDSHTLSVTFNDGSGETTFPAPNNLPALTANLKLGTSYTVNMDDWSIE